MDHRYIPTQLTVDVLDKWHNLCTAGTQNNVDVNACSIKIVYHLYTHVVAFSIYIYTKKLRHLCHTFICKILGVDHRHLYENVQTYRHTHKHQLYRYPNTGARLHARSFGKPVSSFYIGPFHNIKTPGHYTLVPIGNGNPDKSPKRLGY